MDSARLLHNHGHDDIPVRLAAFLVQTYDLVDTHIADKVAGDKHEVGGDDAVRVNVTHGVARGEGFVSGHNRYNFDS